MTTQNAYSFAIGFFATIGVLKVLSIIKVKICEKAERDLKYLIYTESTKTRENIANIYRILNPLVCEKDKRDRLEKEKQDKVRAKK